MSDHQGSYMLNDVIELLDKNGIFEFLGREKTHCFIRDMIQIATNKYDCNPGEILEDIGEKLGICYYCLKPAENFKSGLCHNCY